MSSLFDDVEHGGTRCAAAVNEGLQGSRKGVGGTTVNHWKDQRQRQGDIVAQCRTRLTANEDRPEPADGGKCAEP